MDFSTVPQSILSRFGDSKLALLFTLACLLAPPIYYLCCYRSVIKEQVKQIERNLAPASKLHQTHRPRATGNMSSAHKLREEIDAKKRVISSLPTQRKPHRSRTEWADEAKHRQILAEREEELELLLEEQRVAAVVREHVELHPPITEECPICLETIPITSLQSMVFFGCCGNGYCRECHEAATGQGVNKMPTCPLCRAVFPKTQKEVRNLLVKRADDGRPFAQAEIGLGFYEGSEGFPLDKKKALKWFELAAEQCHPLALYYMALIRKEGEVVEKSYPKAIFFMKQSADLGYDEAQDKMARICMVGDGGDVWSLGAPVDESKSFHYSTLGYGQNRDSHSAFSYQLGLFFHNGMGGISRSLYRAKHYFEEAANEGRQVPYFFLAATLLELGGIQCPGYTATLPGHNFIPKVLYWARKSVAANVENTNEAIKLVESLEAMEQSSCANCHRPAHCFSEQLKRCVRCKAVWYCGRDCQQKHWKEGHKIDCIKLEGDAAPDDSDSVKEVLQLLSLESLKHLWGDKQKHSMIGSLEIAAMEARKGSFYVDVIARIAKLGGESIPPEQYHAIMAIGRSRLNGILKTFAQLKEYVQITLGGMFPIREGQSLLEWVNDGQRYTRGERWF